jgi:hypothetical protein
VLDVRGGLGLEAKAVDNLGGDVTARCKDLARTCGSEVDGAGVPAVSSVSMRRMATESDGIVGALLKKVRVAPEVREATRTM